MQRFRERHPDRIRKWADVSNARRRKGRRPKLTDAELRERKAAYRRAHPEKHAADARRYRERHAQKVRARKMVQDRVRRGVIQKLPCHCGETKVQAHHPRGYEGPAALDVEWLCGPHHRARHVGA